MAQLVERILGKDEVISSILISSSITTREAAASRAFGFYPLFEKSFAKTFFAFCLHSTKNLRPVEGVLRKNLRSSPRRRIHIRREEESGDRKIVN